MPKTTSLPKLKDITKDFPNINFREADVFYWSARDRMVHYNPAALSTERGLWQLLHELSHGKLNHRTFRSSIALLKMETEAWAEAKILAKKYQLTIDENHIQKCLDTYRDWLHQRSTCPDCSLLGLETSDCHFACFNCGKRWKAGSNQLSRCYRQNLATKHKLADQ